MKDYPLGEWMEAADSCDFCRCHYEVRIHEGDESGCFGTVEWRIHHKVDCHEVTEYYQGAPVTEISSMDFAGWEFMGKPIKFRGREYYPLKARANVGPCLECGRLVIGVPLILFIDQGRGGELDFCFECAEKLGIFKDVVKETTR